MAWYALWKWFSAFRTTPYENMISWYSGKLYQDWYNSLTDEQKARLEEYRRQKRERAIKNIASIMGAMAGISSGMGRGSYFGGDW